VTDRPTVSRDRELRDLARLLEREADRWRRAGLYALADALAMAAEYADSWAGLYAEDDRA
jgi:hypothetical protein